MDIHNSFFFHRWRMNSAKIMVNDEFITQFSIIQPSQMCSTFTKFIKVHSKTLCNIWLSNVVHLPFGNKPVPNSVSTILLIFSQKTRSYINFTMTKFIHSILWLIIENLQEFLLLCSQKTEFTLGLFCIIFILFIFRISSIEFRNFQKEMSICTTPVPNACN